MPIYIRFIGTGDKLVTRASEKVFGKSLYHDTDFIIQKLIN